MLRLEFHCHTIYSKDSLLKPEALLETCRRKGIDRLVISDHNTIAGALVASSLDPTRVIVGEEILTQKGELLAAYLSEEIPPGLSPQETIQRLRDQDAFISVSHPFDRMRKGHWELPDLLEILPLVDAIETFNARGMYPGSNQLAQTFAEEHSVLGTAGSDAHAAFEVGRAAMLLPEFHDADSLRQSLNNARFETRQSGWWVHFSSRYAVWVKKLRKVPY